MYAQANQAGLASVLQMVHGLGIECDLETGVPHVIYAEHPEDLPALEAEAELAERMGLATWTDSAPVPFAVAGALRFSDQAQFAPRAPPARSDRGVRARWWGARRGDPCSQRGRARRRVRRGDHRGSPAKPGHVIIATEYRILDRGGRFTRTEGTSFLRDRRRPGAVGPWPAMTINAGTRISLDPYR